MSERPTYDTFGIGYGAIRRPDGRIQQAINDALAGALRVVNVGAGAGSYEPGDRCIAAVEPSMVMIRQRASGLAPSVQATDEAIPLCDRAADAALAVHTVLHWNDLARGLSELRRIAPRTVILTMDSDVVRELWIIKDYAPEMAATHVAALPPIRALVSALPGAEVRTVRVPSDCTDGFLAAFWGRPEAYLDPAIRRATSPWHQISADAADRAVQSLADDLADGSWESRYGHLRSANERDVGMRLVIAT